MARDDDTKLEHDFIRLHRNPVVPNIYEIEMEHIDKLKKYDSVECHLVLYPHSRRISSANMTFTPFEEYVKDISPHHRSEYTPIARSASNIFGIYIGLLIVLLVYLFRPVALLSVEAIVSVFGAYFVGKQLWADIEKLLVNMTKNRRIRYQESYYPFRLEKHTTLTHYSTFAKKHRYGKFSMLPEKIDFIPRSNSQTLRMFFNMKDLGVLPELSTHILSIHMDPSLLEEFEEHGFLLGIKLSLNRNSFPLVRHFELFQSMHRDTRGCLGVGGEWEEGGVFYRKTVSLGRLKYYKSHGVIPSGTIMKRGAAGSGASDGLEKSENDGLGKSENDGLEKSENDGLEKSENDGLEKSENDGLEKSENDEMGKNEHDRMDKGKDLEAEEEGDK